jgi:hypothetical protein
VVRFYNIQFICLLRLVEMAVISPSSTGAGIKAFIDVFDEERLFFHRMGNDGNTLW